MNDLLPREKAIKYGIASLNDNELLALILKTAYRNCNVLTLSNNLIAKVGGFNNLLSLTYDELIEIKGIKEAKALELLAILEIYKRLSKVEMIADDENIINPLMLVDFLRFNIGFGEQEEFFLVLLNNKGKIIKAESMYKGTSDSSLVAINEILRKALLLKTKFAVIAHNHPSGNINPSSADIRLTKAIIEGCSHVGIILLDHLIVSATSYFSFKSNGLLLK